MKNPRPFQTPYAEVQNGRGNCTHSYHIPDYGMVPANLLRKEVEVDKRERCPAGVDRLLRLASLPSYPTGHVKLREPRGTTGRFWILRGESFPYVYLSSLDCSRDATWFASLWATIIRIRRGGAPHGSRRCGRRFCLRSTPKSTGGSPIHPISPGSSLSRRTVRTR